MPKRLGPERLGPKRLGAETSRGRNGLVPKRMVTPGSKALVSGFIPSRTPATRCTLKLMVCSLK